MTNAGIKNGDYVIMRRAEEPDNGKVMLVRYGNESTIKRIKLKGGKSASLLGGRKRENC
jgi:SOS-response transcriptional repressor LexA